MNQVTQSATYFALAVSCSLLSALCMQWQMISETCSTAALQQLQGRAAAAADATSGHHKYSHIFILFLFVGTKI